MTQKPPVSRNVRIAEWAIPILLLAVLGISSYGPIQKQIRAAEKTSAIGNFKQVFTALYSYASDHDGHFPSDLESESPTAAACFDKLIKAEKIDEELTFRNKKNAQTLSTASTSPPNEVSPLTENENTTGYVMGLTTESRTNIPILFDSSTEAGVFNTSVWEGQAIVVKINGSSQAMNISYGAGLPLNEDGSGKIGRLTENNKDIFQRVPEGCKILPPQLAK
ncbi:MAG: hypothetical protein ACI9FG_000986 [Crocinitomicaceae bacterium]|jgi:hypothetical protein